MPLKKTAQGFTLVEIMIALMILAIALAAIIRVTTQSAAQASYLRNKTIAQWIALNIFAELELGMRKVSKTLDSQDGEERMLNQTWYWAALFRSTENKSILRTEIMVGLTKKKLQLIRLTAFLRMDT